MHDTSSCSFRAPLPLDPALAEVLFAWKRASEFSGEGDWIFASPQKAGELPLRSSTVLTNYIKPAAAKAEISGKVGWHTFRHYVPCLTMSCNRSLAQYSRPM
jgi:hypothetical protein